ncbi:MAG: hypothetical protein E7001_07900 [Coriobacteriaceae bacterium]|nr:hypothetical protein [Coriobacteriaceae bacterium]
MDDHPHKAPILPRRARRVVCAAGLAAALAWSGSPIPAAVAASTETADGLTRLSAEVDEATRSYAGSMARSRELADEVDRLADEVLALEQEALPAARDRAGEAAVNLYKMRNGSADLLAALLSVDSLSSLADFDTYLGAIQDAYVDDLEELMEVHDTVAAKLAAVSAAKDEAEAERSRAAEALGRAQDAQRAMEERAASEDAAEAEAARRAAEKAAAEVARVQAEHADAGGAGAGPVPEAPANEGDGSPQPAETEGANDGAAAGGEGDGAPASSGWRSGVASYYGIGDGFMGGTTASGETVTETSMGVAMLNVPFGTRVEISFGGRSVIAYVNDRGPYVHGRVIDMQPAVARALGFINTGVGTVRYRFL